MDFPINLPVLAICGFSGSGKTTLIEAVLPELAARGLKVAVIKHDAHGLMIDHPGKDSDRLFTAGADVFVHGVDEYLLRGHKDNFFNVEQQIRSYLHNYDLILIEGHKDTPIEKIWLDNKDRNESIPENVEQIVARFSRDQDRMNALLIFLDKWLADKIKKIPVYACILIGGKSTRMGRPKHLLEIKSGISWIEHQINEIKESVDYVVIAGAGDLPLELSHVQQLVDSPDVQGPMAGILSAMRWKPDVCWIFTACDMPKINSAAIAWLLAQRKPGTVAIQPRIGENKSVQPLLACYEMQASSGFETMCSQQNFKPSELASYCKSVSKPVIPDNLHCCWDNFNDKNDLNRV